MLPAPTPPLLAAALSLLAAAALYRYTMQGPLAPEDQFCSITGASAREAKRYLDKYKRVDVAVDAYYNDVSSGGGGGGAPSTSKLAQLFDAYKDPDGDAITVDGTLRLCADLAVDPEDVVLLAVAYELRSPRVGEWTRRGWVEGWRNVGCDSIAGMKAALPRLREKLGADFAYFQKVYAYTFEFARAEGQRSLALESAQAFWGLLLPHGLQGGALAHVRSRDGDGDESMESAEDGWRPEYLQWWFEFLDEKGGKGVSKDTWMMFLDFVRTIDAEFEKYDMEAAWPSTIDDFVEWAKARVDAGRA